MENSSIGSRFWVRNLEIFALTFLAVWPHLSLGDGGFLETRKTTGVFSFEALPRVSESVLHIWDTDPSYKCSATFLSKDGTFLTAIHCVEFCLKSMGAWIENRDMGDGITIDLGADVKKTVGKQCLLSTPRGDIRVEVLAVGKGDLSFNPLTLTQVGWDKVSSLRSQGFGVAQDFALLKTEDISPHNHSCVDLGRVPNFGSRLWTVGYPRMTKRDVFPNSDGRGMFVSTGLRTSGVESIPLLKEYLQPRRTGLLAPYIYRQISFLNADEIMERLNQQYLEAGTLLSTVDIVSGNSGGGVFNARGELVAINSRSVFFARSLNDIPADTKIYIEGSSMHISTHQIFASYSGPRPVCRHER